jgi:DNA-binding FadR family transcriptional regulator
MRDHMEAELAELRRRPSMRQMLPPGASLSSPDGVKLAEGVSREVAHEVVSGRLQPGHLLGSEADLMERYGVSRAVLREAVRLLEHHQIAQMRRGPGGGLFVVEPSSAAVADVVAIFLASRGAGTTALAELRARVEAELVGLVIDRMDEAGAAALEESLEVGEGDDDADVSIHNLHANLARLSGNRVLELISLVLIRLTRFHQAQALTRAQAKDLLEEVNRIHLGIARAIQAKDLELAQKRIRRHLDVLTTHLH